MPKSENQCIILSFVLRIMPQTCSSCAGEILSLPHCACRLCCFGRVRFYVTLWTVAWQAPLSMGSFQQEHWSGLPCPPSGDLPHHGWKLHLFHVLCWQVRIVTTSGTGEFPPFSPLEKCRKNLLVMLAVPFKKLVFNKWHKIEKRLFSLS